jgi:SAM-dependent methyltransferase
MNNAASLPVAQKVETGAPGSARILAPIKALVHRIGKPYVDEVCRREWSQQEFHRVNERPVEFSFALGALNDYPVVTVLDVGSGVSPFPATMAHCGYLVTAMDNVTDYWPEGMSNRHFHVLDDDIRRPRTTQKFDAITCISVMEHIAEFTDAARGIGSLLKTGGHLILTCPYNETRYCKDVYREPGATHGQNNPYICQSYSRPELTAMVEAMGGRVVRQEYWKVYAGVMWANGQRLDRAVRSSKDEPHQLTCVVIEKVK